MNVRNIALGLVAAGVMALGSAAFAQNVPSQFVVSGKAAEQIQDFSTINLATAERIAETCEKLAAAENVAISMYVLDNAGPSDKFVQNNTGGKTLRCTGNQAPFVGAPNPGWQQYQGQCHA